MADVDTEDKRRAVQAMTFGLVRPVADNDIAAADRGAAQWLYSSGGAPVVAAGTGHLRIGVKPIWFRGTS